MEGDNHAPHHVIGLLLNGFLESGWIKGCKIEACWAEYQSFVKEQRQLQRYSTRSRYDVGDILSFSSLQAGFHARQHLFMVCIVTNKMKFCDRPSCKWIVLFFPEIPANSSLGTWVSNFRWKVHHQPRACNDCRWWSVWCSALRAKIVRSLHLTQRNFLFDSGIALLAGFAAICDSIRSSAVFEPWSHLETSSCSQVVAEVCVSVNRPVDRRMTSKDSQEQWYAVGGIRPCSEDSASHSGVRISNVMEERRVEYVPLSVFSISTPGPSNLRFFQKVQEES